MNLVAKHAKQQILIDSHSWREMTQDEQLRIDLLKNVTNCICTVCNCIVLEGVFISKVYFVLELNDAELFCNQILMRNILK